MSLPQLCTSQEGEFSPALVLIQGWVTVPALFFLLPSPKQVQSLGFLKDFFIDNPEQTHSALWKERVRVPHILSKILESYEVVSWPASPQASGSVLVYTPSLYSGMSGGRLATEPSWTLLGKVEEVTNPTPLQQCTAYAKKVSPPLWLPLLFHRESQWEEVNPMVAGSCPQDTQRKRFTGM